MPAPRASAAAKGTCQRTGLAGRFGEEEASQKARNGKKGRTISAWKLSLHSLLQLTLTSGLPRPLIPVPTHPSSGVWRRIGDYEYLRYPGQRTFDAAASSCGQYEAVPAYPTSLLEQVRTHNGGAVDSTRSDAPAKWRLLHVGVFSPNLGLLLRSPEGRFCSLCASPPHRAVPKAWGLHRGAAAPEHCRSASQLPCHGVL